jgi:Zn-dependent protease
MAAESPPSVKIAAMDEIIAKFAVYALPVLFAFTWHEAAHAYAAYYCGDKTAFLQGRVTLHPEKHIDLLGTIIFPIVTFMMAAATGFPIVFGYAKPVPINFGEMRQPKRDLALVSFAGPAANFVMALFWLLIGLVAHATQSDAKFLQEMCEAGISVNLLFFALNMLPLPPLDGGRVLIGLLPHKYALQVVKIEPYGFYIIAILLMASDVLFKAWISPVMHLAGMLLALIVSPLTYFLN